MRQQNKITKKIICVTTGRSDIFIWKPIWKRLIKESSIQLIIAATGMHLKVDGQNYSENLENIKTVYLGQDLGGLSPKVCSSAMAKINQDFSELYERIKPDLIFVLGDRLDMLPAVVASLPFNIPIIHLHGGEITLGAIDNKVRNAVSELSSLHFVAHKFAKNTLINKGLEKDKIYITGAPGLDNLKKVKKLSKKKLFEELNIDYVTKFFLCTIHSETKLFNSAEPMEECLKSFLEFKDYFFLFSHSNSDPCNKNLNKMLIKTSQKNNNIIFFEKLDYRHYINLMRYSLGVVGNSSSGIIEAPYMGKCVINVGNRQKGRIVDKSVIHCKAVKNEISKCILRCSKRKYKSNISKVYGNGKAGDKIHKLIKKFIMA